MQNNKSTEKVATKSRRKRIYGIILTLLAILAIALPLTWAIVSNYQAQENQVVMNQGLSTIKIKDLDGNRIDLTQFNGKVVFINFWATWCAPCIAEMPSIESAAGKLPKDKIVFLLASNEPVDRITAFMKRRQIDLEFVQLENLEELGVQVLPTTYIIDAAGQLAFSDVGSREWDTRENMEMIKKIINQ